MQSENKQGVKVSPQDEEEICKLYSKGKTLPYLSKLFSRSKSTISRIINDKEISRGTKYISNGTCVLSSPIVINKILFDYNHGKSGNAIAKDLGVSSWSVYKVLSSKSSSNSLAKSYERYIINHDVFDNIDSHAKAYWLGFIAADGHVSDRYVSIRVSEKDMDHLYKFRQFIESDVPIRSYSVKKYKCCQICIYSKNMVKSLRNLGLNKNKTFDLNFPSINKEFYSSYILGVFDGDGSFTGISKKFSIAGNKNHLKEIQNILMSNCNLSETKLYDAGGCHLLEYSGKYQVKRIADFIYRDSIYFLDRKSEIIYGK